MIKKIIATLVPVVFSTFVYGQGTVNFNTLVLGTSARVTSSTNGIFASGTGYYAQLYAADGVGASLGSLTPKGSNPVNFRTSANAGYVQTTGTSTGAAGSFPVITTVPVTSVNGGAVTLQLRAWSSAFSTFEAAMVAPGAEWGMSTLLNIGATGRGGDLPAGTPVNLIGLQGFQLTMNPIPEPSTYALAGLAGGVMMLMRRRRA